ncbi:MAG: acyl-ACP thioesterase domain-containing protein [Acidimicrobiia bacterium]
MDRGDTGVGPVEFVPLPERGRVYRTSRRVHLGDVGEDGRLRLEAVARFLQDAATDDADDAELADGRGVWVVRRVDLEIIDRPHYHEHVDLATFCSGTGPRWAERRTRMTGRSGVLVEAVSLWVFIDGAGGRSLPLDDDFHRRFGESAGGRRVSGRLRHRPPPAECPRRTWPLREGDFDVLNHVNNARSLEAIEDEMAARIPGTRPVRAGVEYRGALERGDAVELASEVVGVGPSGKELSVWLLTGGEVRISAVVTTGPIELRSALGDPQGLDHEIGG